MRRWLPVILVLAATRTFAASGSPERQISVIANSSTPASEISQATLRGIFLMRIRQWPGDGPIRVFVLPDRNSLHRAFSRDLMNTYPYVIRDTWDRLVFTGAAQAPVEVENEQELLRRVASTPGAIGYVEAGKEPSGAIKILRIR